MSLDRVPTGKLRKLLRSFFPWRRREAIREVLRRKEQARDCWVELLRRLDDRNVQVRTLAQDAVRSNWAMLIDTALTHYRHLVKHGSGTPNLLVQIGSALYPVLREAQRSEHENRRWAAADLWAALLEFPEHKKRAMHALVHSLFHDVGLRGENTYFAEHAPAVILRAREALGSVGIPIVPLLRRRFFHQNELISREILTTLGEIGPEAVETIVDLGFSHPDRLVRNMAGSVIQRLGVEGFRELKRILPSRPPAVRAMLLQTVDTKTMRDDVGTFAADAVMLLSESDPELRELGAWIIATIKFRASGDDEWALHHWKHGTTYQPLKAQFAQARAQGFGRLRHLQAKPKLREQARDSLAERAEEICRVTMAALNDSDPLIRENALWCLALACEHVSAEQKESIERALVLLGMSAEDRDEHALLSDALARLGERASKQRPTSLVLQHFGASSEADHRLLVRCCLVQIAAA